jgi:hypothetical protein
MIKYLNENDHVEFTIQAGEYFKMKSGSALDWGLTGFDVEMIRSNPSESEDYSNAVGDFRCHCHDEFVLYYGSYKEFSESYTIKIRVILSDGNVLESV